MKLSRCHVVVVVAVAFAAFAAAPAAAGPRKVRLTKTASSAPATTPPATTPPATTTSPATASPATASPAPAAPAAPSATPFKVEDCDTGPIEVPVTVKNLQIQCKTSLARIAKSEGEEANGALSKNDLQYTRISVQSLFRDLLSAKDESSAVQNHVVVKHLLAIYPQMDARLRRMETKYTNCEFGLKDANTGAVTAATVDTTKEQFSAAMSKAVHATVRCWIKGTRDGYL